MLGIHLNSQGRKMNDNGSKRIPVGKKKTALSLTHAEKIITCVCEKC